MENKYSSPIEYAKFLKSIGRTVGYKTETERPSSQMTMQEHEKLCGYILADGDNGEIDFGSDLGKSFFECLITGEEYHDRKFLSILKKLFVDALYVKCESLLIIAGEEQQCEEATDSKRI
jgi:hypothetical protein